MIAFDEKYWTSRYNNGQTQWDAGKITLPLEVYFNTLNNKDINILIPGGGNGYEAAYLHDKGFRNVYLLDFSAAPLQRFRENNPTFPPDHLLQKDFFEMEGQFDLMVEQTFFCAISPKRRNDYARKASEILKPGAQLIGVLFEAALNDTHPPFGGERKEYRSCFEPFFHILKMETCYNSIKPREGSELWIDLERKQEPG